MRKSIVLVFLVLQIHLYAQQNLKPGFIPQEFLDALTINYQFTGLYNVGVPTVDSSRYKMIYLSPELGLNNRWALWRRNDNIDIISIRGTILAKNSWLENFFAEMIPATGVIYFNKSDSFKYKLAEIHDAGVHAGWLLGLSFIAPTIVEQIKKEYKNGIKEFLIHGHSQGGAIATYLTSYLYYLKKDGILPNDVFFKTYSSASPKQGNKYYSYDFSHIIDPMYAYNVINIEDFSGDSPFTTETYADFAHYNPLRPVYFRESLKHKNIFLHLAACILYHQLNRSLQNARKTISYIFGDLVYSNQIKKTLVGLHLPKEMQSSNYVDVATLVPLVPDSIYNENFKIRSKSFTKPDQFFFYNHHYEQYKELILSLINADKKVN
ncbi:MAG: hypothetical protein QM528_06420 [Phycisphaerales bacterium]|nr:hypothetical protein [Phycisphaerales bacterium]